MYCCYGVRLWYKGGCGFDNLEECNSEMWISCWWELWWCLFEDRDIIFKLKRSWFCGGEWIKYVNIFFYFFIICCEYKCGIYRRGEIRCFNRN